MKHALTKTGRTIGKTVDRMPLGGKYLVRQLTESLFSSESQVEARVKFFALNLLLGIYELGHGSQAMLGTSEMVKDGNKFLDSPSFVGFAETAMDGAYTLINVGVITANTLLLTRLWNRALKKGFVSSKHFPKRRKLGERDSLKLMLATLAITVVGNNGYRLTTSLHTNHQNTKQVTSADPEAKPFEAK